jgi:hypothetical protein
VGHEEAGFKNVSRMLTGFNNPEWHQTFCTEQIYFFLQRNAKWSAKRFSSWAYYFYYT